MCQTGRSLQSLLWKKRSYIVYYGLPNCWQGNKGSHDGKIQESHSTSVHLLVRPLLQSRWKRLLRAHGLRHTERAYLSPWALPWTRSVQRSFPYPLTDLPRGVIIIVLRVRCAWMEKVAGAGDHCTRKRAKEQTLAPKSSDTRKSWGSTEVTVCWQIECVVLFKFSVASRSG